jgi:hypothetical protein
VLRGVEYMLGTSPGPVTRPNTHKPIARLGDMHDLHVDLHCSDKEARKPGGEIAIHQRHTCLFDASGYRHCNVGMPRCFLQR